MIWEKLSETAEKLLYRPTKVDHAGVGDATFEPWRQPDGGFLGYVRQSERSAERTIVFFHGKDGEALEGSWIAPLLPPGCILVLAEYPGYGARSGAPSQNALFDAALEVARAAKRQWGLPLSIIGESLGCAMACYVASRHAVERLALVSPFSCLSDIVAYRFPMIPISRLWHGLFSAATFLGEVTAPLHMVHGDADRVVPIALARKLGLAYQGAAKEFTVIRGAGHVSIRRAIIESPAAATFRHFVGRSMLGE